jgi:plastocyanin
MLTKYILRVAVAAAALTFSAGASAAEQYRIMMMDEAFFPEVTYLTEGDQVIFVNMSGETRNIAAADESWTVTDLGDGAEAAVTVTQGMSESYKTATAQGVIEGQISFNNAAEAAPAD